MKELLAGGGTDFYDAFEELADHAVSCARRLHELAGGIPEESPECRQAAGQVMERVALHNEG